MFKVKNIGTIALSAFAVTFLYRVSTEVLPSQGGEFKKYAEESEADARRLEESFAKSRAATKSLSVALPPGQVLDQWSNSYFWYVRPEMLNRRIQPSQKLYQREWLAVRAVLQEKLVWMQLPGCVSDSGEYDYELPDYKDAHTAIADAVFYTRHPELRGRKLRPSETRLIEEWNSIYKSFPYSPC